MQKLYRALADAHPGFEVVDVKFMANPGEAKDQKISDLDAAFAVSVGNAEEITADFFA